MTSVLLLLTLIVNPQRTIVRCISECKFIVGLLSEYKCNGHLLGNWENFSQFLFIHDDAHSQAVDGLESKKEIKEGEKTATSSPVQCYFKF